MVSRVDTYKEFVPWCQRSVITHRWSEERVDAELEVGFKMFVERCAGLGLTAQALQVQPACPLPGTSKQQAAEWGV